MVAVGNGLGVALAVACVIIVGDWVVGVQLTKIKLNAIIIAITQPKIVVECL